MREEVGTPRCRAAQSSIMFEVSHEKTEIFPFSVVASPSRGIGKARLPMDTDPDFWSIVSQDPPTRLEMVWQRFLRLLKLAGLAN